MAESGEENKKSRSESAGETVGRYAGEQIGKQVGGKLAGTAAGGAASTGAGATAGTAAGTAAGAAGGTAAGATGGAAAGSVIPGVGTAIGAAAGSALGQVFGKYIVKGAKFVLLAVVGVLVSFFLCFIVLLVIIIPVILGMAESEAAPLSSLTVSKTADRSQLQNDDPNPVVNYTIDVANKGNDPITNIAVSDDKCRISYTIAQLDGNKDASQTFACTLDVSQHDSVFVNTVTATGNLTTTNPDGSQTATPLTVTAPPAVVTIGNPPECPPAFSPLKGPEVLIGEGNDYLTPVSYGAHQGVDIHTTGLDWNVYSPFPCPAIVDTVGDYGTVSYGKYVVLRSGGWTTLMAHLASFAVQVGQTVSQDSVLGVMDSTGNSTGTHVHYEIREAGTLVNPHDYGALIPHQ